MFAQRPIHFNNRGRYYTDVCFKRKFFETTLNISNNCMSIFRIAFIQRSTLLKPMLHLFSVGSQCFHPMGIPCWYHIIWGAFPLLAVAVSYWNPALADPPYAGATPGRRYIYTLHATTRITLLTTKVN